MKSKSSVQVLAEIIEKTVRRVVREELSKVAVQSQANAPRPTQNTRPSKSSSHTNILQSILEDTRPFTKDELNESSFSRVDVDFDTEFTQNVSGPTSIVSQNMELDPATARIAEILNKSNHKAVFEASKKFSQ